MTVDTNGGRTAEGRDGGAVDTGDEVPRSVLEELVAAPRRRYVLARLARESDPVSIDDLAAGIAAAESGQDRASLDADDRRRAREDIYQQHLPKLTATGVVRFDSMRGAIELAPGVDLPASVSETEPADVLG